MDVRKFVLSYYENATENFHINEITHPKSALSLHSHDYFQIYYLKCGRIIHHLESSSATLSPGDVFIIPPELVHFIETSSDELLFYSISFAPSFLTEVQESNKLIKDFIHYLTELSRENVPPSFTLGAEDAALTDALIRRIMSEFSGGGAGRDSVIKSAMGLLLSLFARSYLEEKCDSIRIHSEREAISHCVAYLANHLSEHLSLDEIARKTAMSRTVFCRVFSEVMGETFGKYLNRIRVENAARLIRSGESATVAAQLSGYSDFSTFYRNFKRNMGISASEYARSLGG